MYKKKNVELQKSMNECKENEDIPFDEFLEKMLEWTEKIIFAA